MKAILRCLALILLIGCLCSCSVSKKVRYGFYRGMYEGMNQLQKAKHPDQIREPDKQPPTYEQYNRERQAILTGHGQAGNRNN